MRGGTVVPGKGPSQGGTPFARPWGDSRHAMPAPPPQVESLKRCRQEATGIPARVP